MKLVFESRQDVPYVERNLQPCRYKSIGFQCLKADGMFLTQSVISKPVALSICLKRRDVPYAERNFQTRCCMNRFFHRVQKNIPVLKTKFQTY